MSTFPEIKVSKLDAAKRQLETAIVLYFNSGEPVSVHTLSCAARQILVDLCEHRKVEVEFTLKSLIASQIAPQFHKKVLREFAASENFFKHAERDPEGNFDFIPQGSEFVIFESLQMYFSLTSEASPLMRLFSVWWQILHKDFLLPSETQKLKLLNSIAYTKNDRGKYFMECLPLAHRISAG